MKKEFIEAKHKLRLMQKLHHFHEGVMALSIPDYDNDNTQTARDSFASSLRLYAKKYCELLKQYLTGNRDVFLESYSDCDGKNFETFFKHDAKDLFELSIWPAWLVKCDHHGMPIANKELSGKDLGNESIKKMVDILKNNINNRMSSIRLLLKHTPKPKVNIFQKIFGRKKYFEFKKTSVR